MANSLVSALPQPGVRLQVIGAGLPRSGTNSFCAAVSYLLGGPAYHAAVQCALSQTSDHVLALTRVLKLRIRKGRAETGVETELLRALAAETEGWVATADAPLCLLVPELLQVYPDAKVICFVRGREEWARSMWKAARMGNPATLSWLYYWVPVVCHSPTMWSTQTPIWRELFGTTFSSKDETMKIWDKHHDWLRTVVSSDRLTFIDPADGWEPLCRALNVPVPQDIPFPRLNDAKALERKLGDFAAQGLLRWGMVLAAPFLILVLAWQFV